MSIKDIRKTEVMDIRRQAVALIGDLRDVRTEVQNLLNAAGEAQRARFTHQVQVTATAFTRAIETGDHASLVVAITSLLNSHDEMMRDWHVQSLQAYPGLCIRTPWARATKGRTKRYAT